MTDTMRERIARIINPLFDHHEPHLPEWEEFGDRQRAIALEKADQILAELGARWRPIAEAPKDGTPFLGYWPGGGEWKAPTPGVQWTWYWQVGDYGKFSSKHHQGEGPQPTHWMPLPPAPEVDCG